MTKEALKLALEALEDAGKDDFWRYQDKAITAIKEALAQPERKYCRGDRLICLETDEYCVIHISGTDRQWIKFPDTYIGVYTNEQIAELFELLPKEIEQEPVAWDNCHEEKMCRSWCGNSLCASHYADTTPPQRKPLSDEEIKELYGDDDNFRMTNKYVVAFARAIEAAIWEKQK